MMDTAKTACGFSRVRHFSALGDYQAEHTLTYSMHKCAGGCVLTVECSGPSLRTESVRAAMPEAQAAMLMELLYENAAPIETWKDILEELVPEDAILVDEGK